MSESHTDDRAVATYDASNVAMSKKITCERVVGKITQAMIPNKGEPPNWLFGIVGEVRGFEMGTTTYGPYMRVSGEFISRNFETGEEIEAPTCILPALGEMVVKTELDALGFGKEGGPKSITFTMQIGIMFSQEEKAEINGNIVEVKKYQWTIRPMGVRSKSPLRLTMEKLMPTQKSLPAPTVPEKGKHKGA